VQENKRLVVAVVGREKCGNVVQNLKTPQTASACLQLKKKDVWNPLDIIEQQRFDLAWKMSTIMDTDITW
jgi:hypothetical protein